MCRMRSVVWCAGLLALCLVGGQVRAQGAYNLHEKGIERINEARSVAPLSVDTLFGDHISHFDGGVTFTNVDITVPGNSGLPVELRRSLRVDDRSKVNGNHLGGFGEWSLDIPRLSSEVAVSFGWRTSGGTVNQRCSVPGALPDTPMVAAEDYWGGYRLSVPGAGEQQLLMNPSSMIPAAGGGPYPWITKDMWRISCKSATKNGYAGQAFLAVSPEGIKYHLDWAITKAHASLNSGLDSGPMPRQVVHFLVSRVEDRFGNWVDYSYSGDRLTGIAASDGRQISLVWSGSRITSASSSVGSWSYSYSGDRLSQVTQPDAGKWSYVTVGALQIYPPGWSPLFEDPTGCPDSMEVPTGSYALNITAPSGASAQFNFGVRQHFRSNIPAHACFVHSPQYWFMKVPRFHWSLSLVSKVVTGPGLPSMTWNFTYGGSLLMPGNTKQNTVSGPGNTFSRYTFGTGYNLNEGQLLAVETGSSASNILQTQASAYVTTAQASGQNFPAAVGTNPRLWADLLSSAWLRPLRESVTTRQGVDFKWQADSGCSGKLCFDAFARPTRVTRSSTLAGSPARTEQTTYHDNTALWVLGQVAQVRCTAPTGALPAGCGASGTLMSETSYHATWAVPLVSKRFGKTVQTLGYDTTSSVASGQRGTVRTVADGNGNAITLTAWKRGIPQSIKFPATPEAPGGATQSAAVDNAGRISSVTDENGYVTNYTYDAMGRLASITWPTGDSTAWNTTTQAFQQIASSEYGIPAGHWRQTVATGNGRRITYFDGLWRPLVTREYDTGNQSGTQRFQRFTYDHAGRTTFASYPSTASSASTGTWTEYDALGRPTSVSQDSELSPAILVSTTQYLNGFQTRSTNPKGHQTTTTYLAWDQPTTEHPLRITHPAGAYTHITRDVFGKPTRLRRSNSSSPTGGTVALDRNYAYNAHQELCRAVEPEIGATLMGYDGAGNLTWSASGLPAGTACHATGNHSTINPRKATRSYDARNRLTALAFANGIGNQAWTYTPDGLPATISTHNTSGGGLVTNAYEYNRRRLLVGESVKRGSAAAWALGYGYNANGHLASQTYPSGLAVSYAPNALGQPTQAGSYATGVSWFPNGALKAFTYGNGMVHTATQNARGLPLRTTDCAATGTCSAANRRLDLQYAYDANGNVSQITDHVTGGKQTRGMSYDPLDRLVQTTSNMFGTASYGYDVLDNLNTVHVSGGSQARNHTYAYDPATRRLSEVKSTVGGAVVANLTYDVQGNLASKGGQAYQFDLGNRLRSVPGQETGYEYDGHGRRVFAQTVGSGQVLSQYGNDGKLLYQNDARHGRRTDYVYLGNRLVAYRERPLSSSTATVKYQHVDALGTPIAVTNAAKATIETGEYEPYGRLVNKPLFDGPGYTGHVQDAATGLTYMQQRYYDPELGLFLSVDPVTAYGSPVAQFHRYRYANNNPYKLVDPDGRAAVLAVPVIVVGRCALSSACRTAVKNGVNAVVATLIAVAGNEVYNEIVNDADGPEGSSGSASPEYPSNPDDWVPPDGWTETNAGEKTGGRHRQWKDEEGRIRRRWDREGREGGKERGPHWHDADDGSGGNDHIDPDDVPKPEEQPKPSPERN